MNRLLKTIFFILPLALLYACGGGGKDNPSTPYTPPANVAVSSVSISTTSAELEIGKTLQLTATVSPSNATDKSVSWTTSSATVATVTPTGMVTAKAEGTTNITATCGGKSAVCKVTVKKATIPVTSVELDNTDITIKVGESKTLKVTIKPDNATDKTITWASSKTDIVTVDTDGKVTAVKEGVASVTATCGGKTASCKVTVEKAVVEVTSITLSETTLTLSEGDTKTITATVNPSDATDKTINWTSSDNNVATVSNGTITAKAPGNATITASCGGKTATCQVTVNAIVIDVTSINLSKTSITLTEGDSQTITATINPSNATDKTVTWISSDNNVATVNNGTIMAIAPGNATIQASCGGKTASCQVTVNAKVVAVTSITLSETSLTLTEGDSQTITATINPSDATDKTVIWTSSNNNVATVSNGAITAKAPGNATIQASCGGKTASCQVTVNAKAIDVTSVTLSETSLTLIEGDSQTITATVNPSDATDKTIDWTSTNNSVATVSNGTITAKAPGNATITASCGDKKATCRVTVNARRYITSINMIKQKTLPVGDIFTIYPVIGPSEANDRTLTWSSSDERVATVDNGKITTKAIGSTIITVTSPYARAECKIDVVDYSIILPDKYVIKSGSVINLNNFVYTNPRFNDLEAGYITVTSSNPTVFTQEGNALYAKGEGTATITATISNKKATCLIIVSNLQGTIPDRDEEDF